MQCVKSSCIYSNVEGQRKTSIAPPTTSSSFLTTTTRFQHLPSGYNSQHTTCSTTIPKFQKNNLESHASYKFVLIHSNRIKQVQKGSSTPSNTFFQKCGKQHTSVVNMYQKTWYMQTMYQNVPDFWYKSGTKPIRPHFEHISIKKSNISDSIIFHPIRA